MSETHKDKKPRKYKKKNKKIKQFSVALLPHNSTTLSSTFEGTLLPKDRQLYLEALLLWHAGDWHELARLDITLLKHNPHEIELLCFKAVAHFQLGELDSAKSLLHNLPQTNRSVMHLLISSVFITLSKARASFGHIQHAKQHFENASKAGTICQSQILKQARWCEQLAQNGINSTWIRLKKDYKQDKFNVKLRNQLSFGDAWAGNTVNTVIFRHHGVFTRNNFQYTAFYVDQHTLRVIQRNLTTNEFVKNDITGEFNIKDAHNSISLGMDREEYIHISYDHHGTKLKYRRSQKPNDINTWSEEESMTGENEKNVTYPAFLMPSDNSPLQILYRDGYDRKGSAYLKDYNEKDRIWVDHECAKLSGADNKPWTSNAYWNHPVLDHEGNLHISFTWRTEAIGDRKQINNINICYAKSFDNGKSWYSSNMKPLYLPITQVNAEVIWPVSPASNLINQSSMAVDSLNRPHIVFYANDTMGIVQYQHLWFNGSKWCHQVISQRTNEFDLCGIGTLRIPISRPDIVIDKHDNLFVIYRGDLTNDRMAALFLKAPDYDYCPENQKIIYHEPVGLSEPVIDRLRWEQEQVLSLLIQFNDQPDHDVGHTNVIKPISLVDVIFEV